MAASTRTNQNHRSATFIALGLPTQNHSRISGHTLGSSGTEPSVLRLLSKNTCSRCTRLPVVHTKWLSCAVSPPRRPEGRLASDNVMERTKEMAEKAHRVAIVAVGGNALIKDKNKMTIQDQYAAACDTVSHITNMIQDGWNVIVTHGNGPQVGFDMRRSELAAHELHPVPLDYCDADTQGAIGYMFQRAMHNEFKHRGIRKAVATVVTLVRVNADDPAFKNPTKPVGSFLDNATAQKRMEEGNTLIEDAGRGWRRVVPSPMPVEVVEAKAINTLMKDGVVVIASGGGGIPVVENEEGDLVGIEAVIDKDFSSSLLANVVGADLLLFSTSVEKVALNFNTPDELWLDKMTIAEAKRYIKEGQFAPGSMKPKIEACLKFIENGGKEVLITDPKNIPRALRGETGTRIVP